MKILFIGGTGTISTQITKQLSGKGHELYLLNRGNRNNELPSDIKFINADINDEQYVAGRLDGMNFDVVCDFIGFVPAQLKRDYRLFSGKTKQFMYISSASAYHKPLKSHVITEGTSLANPYWKYSRDKIECENFLMKMYREKNFPVTIIRPSHTYCERSVPVGIHGTGGSWQVLKRMLEGKQVLVHGDGNTLWTMTSSSDFAKGFIGLMGNPHAIGEAFQITSDESITWNQIYQTIADYLGVEYKPYYVSSDFLASVSPEKYDLYGGLTGDKACTVVFDNSKLKRAVPGFEAIVRFEQGAKYALDYVISHPEYQNEDPEFDTWCDDVISQLESARETLALKYKK